MLDVKILHKFLSRLSKREKIVLYAALFFVMSTLLDRLVIYPIYSRVTSLNSEIKQKELAINKYLRILAQEDRIINEKKKYDSYLGTSHSEEKDMTSILKEIEDLANKSSLYIVDMKPGGIKEDKGGTKKYKVNLSCEGEMEQIIDFMYNIENSDILLTIDRYYISPKSKKSRLAQCSMTISKIIIPQ